VQEVALVIVTGLCTAVVALILELSHRMFRYRDERDLYKATLIYEQKRYDELQRYLFLTGKLEDEGD
jgi:hypothetical protein